MRKRNVLLIVVDQWRADCMPFLGTPHPRNPTLDRHCREGVTFRNHGTTALPCGPARASLHTGLYLMNHRQVQNGVPLDRRQATLPQAARAAGYDPALIGYTTTTPDPRVIPAGDPALTTLGDVMPGWRPAGAFEVSHDGYFGGLAQRAFPVPAQREDIWLPEGEDSPPGATDTHFRASPHGLRRCDPRQIGDSA